MTAHRPTRHSDTAPARPRVRVSLWFAAAIFALSAVPFALHGVPVAHAAANAIQIENQNPGDPTWDQFASVSQQDAISGYGSKISVNHGDSIDFFVTTTAASVKIDIYRTGWYQGIGARKMTSLGTFPGVHQAIPPPDPVTGMVACNWTKTATLSIPSNWVTGVYLAKLTASSGNQSFIFFVVRDDGGHEAIEFQTSVTTYQAYNQWGGVSLYANNTSGKVYPYPHATKVSFDRPFDPQDSNGAGHYLYWEYPFVRWAESQGYDLTYVTDVDTHANTNPLTNHQAFLSVGHDEYWSKGMRDNVQAAINAGVNVAFFSANTCYWQIRFEPNAAGVPNRVEVGYKDFATSTAAPGPDPQWGANNTIVTTNWRSDPVNNPENGLLGVMYQDQVLQDDTYVVQNASSWVYAGTGFVNGSTVKGIVGYEYDKVWNNGFTPAGITVLSNSPVVGCCEGSGHSFANSTLYTAPSGARVFAAGTIQWSLGLDNYNGQGYVNAGIQKTTANILANFTSGAPVPAPAVTLSPTNLTFGSQVINTTSGAQTVSLTNSGNATLNISSIAVGGTNRGDFAQTNTCGATLAASGQCTISVTFTPTATGTRTASISITDNATGSPQGVALSGTATSTPAPAVTLNPTSVSFGNQNVQTTSAAHSITLTNSGNAALSITSIGLTGTNAANFAQTNTCPSGSSTLAAGSACTISVTFTPSATGAETASVSITDNATGSPQGVPLSGTGVQPAPAVTLNPTSVSFGNQLVNTTSSAQNVTLTNSGTAPLAISAITVGGTNASEFAQTNTCPISPSTLAATASCTISVAFTPVATGTRSGSVQVTDNAAGSPQVVTLTGTGTPPPAPVVSLSPTSLTFSNVVVNTTSPAQAITLRNAGNAALTITSITVSGTNAANFAQTNTCPSGSSTLAAGSTCTISVTFTPNAATSFAASISIADNAAGSPQAVALSGSGVTTSNVLFSDGFESGTLPGNWTSSTVSTGNTLKVDTSFAHGGSDSLLAVTTKGSVGNAFITKMITGQTTVDVRAYYYLSNPVNWGEVNLMSLYAQGNFIGWVDYYVDPSSPALQVYNGGNGQFYNCTLPTLNAWHSIELQYVLSTTTSGSFTLWVDGKQACGATGVITEPFSGLTVDQVNVGSDGADNSVGLSVHVDDAVISKSYIGL